MWFWTNHTLVPKGDGGDLHIGKAPGASEFAPAVAAKHLRRHEKEHALERLPVHVLALPATDQWCVVQVVRRTPGSEVCTFK